jgi:hypothetical protein
MRHDRDVPREEPLAGGMHESRAVVRVGDTVRRPVTKSAHAVRALLLHLEQVGFEVRRATSAMTGRVERFSPTSTARCRCRRIRPGR